MPYDDTDLSGSDATVAAWALAWARFYLRDTSVTDPEYSDAELTAVLTATAWEHDSVTYYRPHVAAANIVLGDPDRASSESVLGNSVTLRGASAVANGIRSAGAWVDALISTAAGVTPPSGRTLEPRF